MTYEMPTAKELIDRYPDFKHVAEDRINVFIEDSSSILNQEEWKEKYYKKAIIALAAHKMYCEDEIRRSFSDKMGTNPTALDYKDTVYGQYYIELESSNNRKPSSPKTIRTGQAKLHEDPLGDQ